MAVLQTVDVPVIAQGITKGDHAVDELSCSGIEDEWGRRDELQGQQPSRNE